MTNIEIEEEGVASSGFMSSKKPALATTFPIDMHERIIVTLLLFKLSYFFSYLSFRLLSLSLSTMLVCYLAVHVHLVWNSIMYILISYFWCMLVLSKHSFIFNDFFCLNVMLSSTAKFLIMDWYVSILVNIVFRSYKTKDLLVICIYVFKLFS